MTQTLKPISSFLTASPQAQAVAQMDLGQDRAATIWRNQHDQISYEATEGHTFSFYLKGGLDTWRTDGTPSHGWPGALCIMPQGQNSDWDINNEFTFVHLYISDADLRRIYVETYDRDARSLELFDQTYVEAQSLTKAFQQLVTSLLTDDTAKADNASVDLIGGIVSDERFGDTRATALAGGLSQRKSKLLREFIETHIDQPIFLRELAKLVGLSEFHLQRSFQDSCGVSPQTWISARRIDKAKSLIRAGDTLAQVAASCGFSSQSHLTRAFRAATGVTPGAWRKAI